MTYHNFEFGCAGREWPSMTKLGSGQKNETTNSAVVALLFLNQMKVRNTSDIVKHQCKHWTWTEHPLAGFDPRSLGENTRNDFPAKRLQQNQSLGKYGPSGKKHEKQPMQYNPTCHNQHLYVSLVCLRRYAPPVLTIINPTCISLSAWCLNTKLNLQNEETAI